MSFPYMNETILAVVLEEDPTADEKYHLLHMPRVGHVTEFNVAAQGGFTAADTNSVKVQLLDGGADGTGTAVIGGYDGQATGGDGTLADLNPFADAVTDVKLDADDEVIILYDELGTGPGTQPPSFTVGIALIYGDPAGAG